MVILAIRASAESSPYYLEQIFLLKQVVAKYPLAIRSGPHWFPMDK
jgi:hypothetical protein